MLSSVSQNVTLFANRIAAYFILVIIIFLIAVTKISNKKQCKGGMTHGMVAFTFRVSLPSQLT